MKLVKFDREEKYIKDFVKLASMIYDSSDNINQFVWKIDSDYENLLEYTKGLIQLRKSFNIVLLLDIP